MKFRLFGLLCLVSILLSCTSQGKLKPEDRPMNLAEIDQKKFAACTLMMNREGLNKKKSQYMCYNSLHPEQQKSLQRDVQHYFRGTRVRSFSDINRLIMRYCRFAVTNEQNIYYKGDYFLCRRREESYLLDIFLRANANVEFRKKVIHCSKKHLLESQDFFRYGTIIIGICAAYQK